MLESLSIQNYKQIRSLALDDLKQVNLFTGKNNTGKSSLLEAVAILVNGGTKWIFNQVIDNRLQVKRKKDRYNQLYEEELSMLFTDGEAASILLIEGEKLNYGRITIELLRGEKSELEKTHERFSSAHGGLCFYKKNIDYRGHTHKNDPNFQYVRSSSNSLSKNLQLWDKVVLTDKEDQVVEALQIIEPRINRIAFIQRHDERIAMVRLTGAKETVELQSMGDGINRILSIILAAVNAAEGYLLIDEFENGLHYSVQEQLWEVLLQLAKKLNFQLFVTTHSSDCIDSFEEVLNTQDEVTGQLYRLERSPDQNIKTVVYDKKELQIATDNDIETR